MANVFEHPWLGGFFTEPKAAAIWSPDKQLAHMLAVEATFTRALGHVGTVPNEIAASVARAITNYTVDIEDLRTGTMRDGLPVPALVTLLKKIAGHNDHAVHSGMTSQDVMDTALSLTLKEFNAFLFARLTALVQEIERLSEKFGTASIMGRTRMQAALPITAADRISTWSQPLKTHLTRLNEIRGRVEVLQLGGAVGNRSALGRKSDAIAAEMASQLNLGNPTRSWHSMRDSLAEYANLLSLITGTVGKMGQDICLMSQQGVGEITLKGGGGSSAMPHKQNPVAAELLVTLAQYNAIQVSGMHQALLHEQERSGTAWMLEWLILPNMANATARSLTAASEICANTTQIGTKPGNRKA